MTPALTDAEIDALRDLRELWSQEQLVLIGASALSLHLPLRWRVTQDLDVTVALALSSATTALRERAGWTRSTSNECRWVSPMGVKVDVLPVDVDALREGEVGGPAASPQMTLTGMRLAFDQAVEHALAPGFVFPVAPLPVIAVLKMAAYIDRPSDRISDLHDWAHVLHHYPDPSDEFSARLFTDRVIELDLNHVEAAAFLLGGDIATIVSEAERLLVDEFIRKLRDDEDVDHAQLHLLRGAPGGWRGSVDELLERPDAFQLGLDDPGGEVR